MRSFQVLLVGALMSLAASSPVPQGSGGFCPNGAANPAYVTQQGDNCNNLSTKYKVSTLTLQNVNGLTADQCKNLAPNLTLCVPPPCTVHQKTAQDTCQSIADKAHITIQQFYGYNPGINNPECDNMVVGSEVCLDAAHGSNFPAPQPVSVGN